MKKRSLAACSTSSTSSDSSSLTSVESNPKRPTKSVKPKKPRSKKAGAPKSPPTRSSIYRGVTRHRWTGRFEAHLWDKETWNNVQTKKGRQVYLGAYDNEEAAAKTYDLAAIKYWGPETALNFPVETYQKEIEEMQKLTREEYLATLRRRSSGFSRGVSKFRGVAKHHHNGRWEARIGRVLGNKYLYLGTYSTQEEAAAAYDRAAIQYRGANAVTNFDISNYADLLVKRDPLKEEEEEEEEKKKARNAEQEARNAAQATDEPPQPPNLKHEADDQEDHEGKKGGNMLECQPKCEQAALDPYTNNAQDSSTMGHMMVEDHGMINEHDLSWDLNLNQLPIPNLSDISNSCDINMECELPALFDDYIGFEDNLDFMFSSELDNSLFDLESQDLKGNNNSYTTSANPPTITSSSSSSSLSCLSMSPSVTCEDYLV